MTLGEHVFLYCERGTSTALSAEPINAVSNIAFILAALMGLQLLEWRPREQQTSDHFLLIGLVALIGIGSFAFHLLATQESELLDVIPIDVFMLVYLGFALNRFLGVPPGGAVLTSALPQSCSSPCSSNAGAGASASRVPRSPARPSA